VKIVYVTGCLGFIGSHFTRAALNRGWIVRGVDKLTYAANEELLKEFNLFSNFYFEKKDIKDLDTLYDCDYVINFAAESHVGKSIADSHDFIFSNVMGVQNLLELIRLKSTNCSPRPVFFQISTDEVYGDIVSGSHDEKDLLKPSNPYSASKAAADLMTMAWARTYGIEYLIARPTNNYGINQYPEKLIPLSVKNLQRGKKIRLHDSGQPTRIWLHAEDTVSAIMTIIDSGNVNEIYNISGDFEQRNLDTVKKIIRHFNGTYDEWDKHTDLSYVRQGQDVRYSLDDTKIRKLGWKPKKVFDNEIPSIVQYYKKNFIW
jgi:dTDP-glucose 4,6-dehydratase